MNRTKISETLIWPYEMFGHYNGRIHHHYGETILIYDLIGWAEDHVARW